MAQASSATVNGLGQMFHHNGADVRQRDPLRVVTPAAQWSYAVSFALDPSLTARDGSLADSTRFIVELEVVRGRIGIGWTAAAGNAFLVEKFTDARHARVVLPIAAGSRPGELVIRNASDGGASEFVLEGVRAVRTLPGGVQYPVAIEPREFSTELQPAGGGTETFDTDVAKALNQARLDWLASAQLPINGGRALDVGTGVGHFVSFYQQRGCAVVAVDGREENIAEVRRRHPGVDTHVADVQALDPNVLGSFDVINCVGLLYHLDSPIGALRHLHAMCRGFLILETMVCDSARPLAVLEDETKTFSQALAGLGSRPSPSFITLALNRIGFRYIYAALYPPSHEEFEFEWLDNLDTTRDGHPLRAVFVASHQPIESPMLLPLVE
jgi:2-polyprenyl-3-methyl-5-hydroxy-6-metoxy-1,4-benzoquinol methylase